MDRPRTWPNIEDSEAALISIQRMCVWPVFCLMSPSGEGDAIILFLSSRRDLFLVGPPTLTHVMII